MVVKHLWIALVTGVFTIPAFGQSYYEHILGAPDTIEQGSALEVLPDGQLLAGGFANGMGFSPVNAVFMKFDVNGGLVWGKSLDLGVQEKITALRMASDGNVLALVNTFPESDEQLTSFSALARIDPSTGNVLDVRKFEGVASNLKFMTPVSGGYLLTGSVWNPGAAKPSPVAVKIDEGGSIVWQVALTGNPVDGGRLRGAYENDQKTYIYAVGEIDGADGRDGLVVRFGAAGSYDCKRIGTSGTDALVQITRAKNNHLLMAGQSTNFSNGFNQIWVTETDDTAATLKESYTYALVPQSNDLFTTEMLSLPGDQHLICTGGNVPALGASAGLLWLSAGNQVLSNSKDYGNQTEGSGFEALRALPNGKGFAAAGSWYDQFGFNFFLTQMRPDGSVDQDCCPKDLQMTVTDVASSIHIETIVPDATAPLLLKSAAYLTAAYQPSNKSTCLPIDLQFSLSDTTICPNAYVDIKDIGNTPGVDYHYNVQGGEPDPNKPGRVYFAQDGTITRIGKNAYCTKTMSLQVKTRVVGDQFPNVFTPNNDGLNDVFMPIFPCPVIVSDFRIYDRWGKLVFETKDPLAGWDGKLNGKEAPSDVYGWTVEYEAERGGSRQKYVQKGGVTLLR
jgi:gliding motility-associated-like protein